MDGGEGVGAWGVGVGGWWLYFGQERGEYWRSWEEVGLDVMWGRGMRNNLSCVLNPLALAIPNPTSRSSRRRYFLVCFVLATNI